MKKRSIGVTVFGLSLLLFPVMAVVKLITVCQMSLRLSNTATEYYKTGYPHPLSALFVFVASIVLVICILKLMKWAYYVLLVTSVLVIIKDVYGLISMFRSVLSGGAVVGVWFIEPVVILFYFTAIIYFFTRSKVKEQFE